MCSLVPGLALDWPGCCALASRHVFRNGHARPESGCQHRQWVMADLALAFIHHLLPPRYIPPRYIPPKYIRAASSIPLLAQLDVSQQSRPSHIARESPLVPADQGSLESCVYLGWFCPFLLLAILACLSASLASPTPIRTPILQHTARLVQPSDRYLEAARPPQQPSHRCHQPGRQQHDPSLLGWHISMTVASVTTKSMLQVPSSTVEPLLSPPISASLPSQVVQRFLTSSRDWTNRLDRLGQHRRVCVFASAD
ncbi:uncharacterized protein BJ171DRAFT_216508 [Polychytrium aggregatum]|uniref:uncharacterized protein n=1 Tax=Polychytrium aggregatum TaxID=110093 RepID=UPI0022FF3776|nr:uncharacterized protein BJ171DRAFT_216508 [Polychytrium aggregatum]KAI9199347.1 hypothetical protein BJ171DRAFT_216508 [Polychytrium aggregatum]